MLFHLYGDSEHTGPYQGYEWGELGSVIQNTEAFATLSFVGKFSSNFLASLGTEAQLQTSWERKCGRIEIRTAVVALVGHLLAAYREGS